MIQPQQQFVSYQKLGERCNKRAHKKLEMSKEQRQRAVTNHTSGSCESLQHASCVALAGVHERICGTRNNIDLLITADRHSSSLRIRSETESGKSCSVPLIAIPGLSQLQVAQRSEGRRSLRGHEAVRFFDVTPISI